MRSTASLLFAIVVLGVALLTARAAPATVAAGSSSGACASPVGLANDSFEEPTVSSFALLLQSNVPGWSTTEGDGRIEIWHSGNRGVPAADGEQFAELAGNEPGELYQDLATVPGEDLFYGLFHRGRTGVDTMEVDLGAPGATPSLARQVSTGDTSWHWWRVGMSFRRGR